MIFFKQSIDQIMSHGPRYSAVDDAEDLQVAWSSPKQTTEAIKNSQTNNLQRPGRIIIRHLERVSPQAYIISQIATAS